MFFLVIATLAAFVRGQNFDVPSDWRKPSSSSSRSERLAFAQAAAESLTLTDATNQAMDSWASANVPASLAQHDYISGVQDNHDFVSNSIMASRNASPTFFDATQNLTDDITSDALMWGVAAFYGARAYNDTNLLGLAVGAWNVATLYTVSPQNGTSGTQPKRNVNFPIDCVPGVTSAGAVFWQTQPSNLLCVAEAIGAYAALSAHLWESTGNVAYLNAAEQSASFINTHMYLPDEKIITDVYDIGSCKVTSNQSWTYNQGFFLEALSILSLAPVPDNATWTSLSQTLVVSTIQFPGWLSQNVSSLGVLYEYDHASPIVPTSFQEEFIWRNTYIRGLYAIWARSDPSTPMAELIQAFVTVQYNALLDLASVNGNFYSPIWTGPPISAKLSWGQLSAMDVLSAAVGMGPTNNSAKGSPSAAPPASNTGIPTPRALSSGAIAGIAVGAVAVLTAVVAGCWIIVRRKRRRALANQSNSFDVAGPDPDMLEYEPYAPGVSVSQPREEPAPTAGYASKDRHGYGPGTTLSYESWQPPVLADTGRPSTSTEDPVIAAKRTSGSTSKTALARAIEQPEAAGSDNMQVHDAPPAYDGK
ncbi:hypothetical protein PENSPDRAFT_735605 [Peniophora sp. CONT]|nr:hypothetical protein PENSPDRAFT_735605 [Peniophora sp. CONT]